jgi:NAD-dependent dihydropyrimidine dehydrogenase PreA subunit
MKRKIISIDEEKCNGCGVCASGCPEGALQIIDGKARLVNELFCDGLGACIGTCPQGAITIEERDVEAYDEEKVMENIVKHGKETILAHLKHLKEHSQKEYLSQALEYLKRKKIAVAFDREKGPAECGCPGSKTTDLRQSPSALGNWPIQLQLLTPLAPYFQNADLVIAADCVPFSYANFHSRFLTGKILIVFCPKLDKVTEAYVEKLSELFKHNEIKSLSLVHMEVPCCFGLVKIVEEAIRASGKNILTKEYTISIKGEII